MTLRIFRHFVPASKISLVFLEILLISIVWYFLLTRDEAVQAGFEDIVKSPAPMFAILAGMIMTVTGNYHNKAFLNFRMMAVGVTASFFIMGIVSYVILEYWKISPKYNVEINLLYLKAGLSWAIILLLTRAVFLVLSDTGLLKARVLVIGGGRKAARIASLAAAKHIGHFIPVAYLCTRDEPVCAQGVVQDMADDDVDSLVRLGRKHKASKVVVATDDRRGLPLHQLLQCRLANMKVIDYLDFIEQETKTVDLDALQPGWLIYCDGFRTGSFSRIVKRCFDIVLSIVLLIFTLPVIFVTSLLIKLDSPGPILFRQERVGLCGKRFLLFKFRSMRADAERDGKPRWAANNDPRVTSFGRLIRKVRIDELPQVLNVLRGEMSFVGPRPERPAFVNDFTAQIPFYDERHWVKPGITGWAQINYPYGSSLEDARQKLSYDLYYVKNHGFFLDLVIILQTVRVIFWADGSR